MHPTIDTAANAAAVAALFRSMLEADPAATRALFSFRVGCNQALADHPTVIVRGEGEPWLPAEGPPRGRWDVGFLGVVNALFGPTHRVATICDDVTGEVQDFRVVDVLRGTVGCQVGRAGVTSPTWLGVDLANGPDASATVVVVDGVSRDVATGAVRLAVAPPGSRIGEGMRADYAGPGYPTTASAVCVKDRDGWITCHIDEGYTLTAMPMEAHEWDDRRNRWLADGAPTLPRAHE